MPQFYPAPRDIFSKAKTHKVRVYIEDGKWAFTPDTKEQRDISIIMEFSDTDAEKLVSGFGIDISMRKKYSN